MRLLGAPIPLLTALVLATFCFSAISCGGDAAEESGQEVVTETDPTIVPSDVPEAQAAYDESGELWSTDRAASLAKLREAIDLDPDFLDAHGLLSYRYAWIYQFGDRSDSIISNALNYAESAAAIDPDGFGAISAFGAYYYRIEKDYGKAMEYYTRGLELFPDNGHFTNMQAHVARRQGDWAKALEVLVRRDAMEPSYDALQAILENHRYNRRWDQAMEAAQQMAERYPERTSGPSYMGWIPFYQTGDTEGIRAFHGSQPSGFTVNRWSVDIIDREYEAALAIMDASETEVFVGQNGLTPREGYRAVALRFLGREGEATAAFESARETLEAMLPEYDHDWRVHAGIGWVLANLGEREAAVEAAQRAIDILPPEKDALSGPPNVINLAEVYAILGDGDAAVQTIEYLMSIPCAMNRGWLMKGPVWDGIREHPGFQALVAG